MNNNLIALSGKSGVGKDLVGDIIQYLTMKHLNQPCTIDYAEWCTPRGRNTGFLGRNTGFLGRNHWEIKRFAGKLKDIVCLLIGCTREQLENADFKNTPLGSEWTKYGIVRRDSSKIVTYHPTYEEATKHLEAWEKGAYIQEVPMTPRLMLQLAGTECMRTIIHENTWVNSLFADYKAEFRGGGLSDDDLKQDYPHWIITDLRFPNEKLAVEKHGGITIRISRPNTILMDHPSETSLDDDSKWDYQITNDSTIEDLIEKVRDVLINARII